MDERFRRRVDHDKPDEEKKRLPATMADVYKMSMRVADDDDDAFE